MDSTGQPQPASSYAPQTLTTNIVNNIPVHAPAQQQPQAANEDDELDKIMRDVGHQLKQAERHTPKKRVFHFGHKAKSLPPRPAASPQAMAPIADVKPAASSRPAAPKTTPAAAAKPARPPIMLVLLTVAVTAVLMAAAIYTYRLS